MGKETRGAPGPQPPASNMLKMSWDDELSFVAQRLTDQCIFGHDKERRIDAYNVGQNIYSLRTTVKQAVNWTAAISAFYNEVVMFPKCAVNRFHFSAAGLENIGHYTQLVWADSNKVGCGATRFYRGGSRFPWNILLACNYGPAGNIAFRALYKSGEACSDCPIGTECTTEPYMGLCRDSATNLFPLSSVIDSVIAPAIAIASAILFPNETFAVENQPNVALRNLQFAQSAMLPITRTSTSTSTTKTTTSKARIIRPVTFRMSYLRRFVTKPPLPTTTSKIKTTVVPKLLSYLPKTLATSKPSERSTAKNASTTVISKPTAKRLTAYKSIRYKISSPKITQRTIVRPPVMYFKSANRTLRNPVVFRSAKSFPSRSSWTGSKLVTNNPTAKKSSSDNPISTTVESNDSTNGKHH